MAQSPAAPAAIDLQANEARWPLAQVLRQRGPLTVDKLAERFSVVFPSHWPEPVTSAQVLPIAGAGDEGVAAVLIVGVNPRRLRDDRYRNLLGLISSHISTAIATASAYESERRRAEALAELNRAKTAFFSNVSHEFRTPLTLMLGPLEDLLTRTAPGLDPAAVRKELELVSRNGLRLLRLVNTLLDFSRIEAGRVQAAFEPVDLAALTADLASGFRAATERAGLKLLVQCAPLAAPVFVDREMWEKVVLNLRSNAFKFTFAGAITVTVAALPDRAELRVKDTGVGIPAAELPRVFERFHRVESTRGRTHEGSGIGLALVQDLGKLHGGSVRAESVDSWTACAAYDRMSFGLEVGTQLDVATTLCKEVCDHRQTIVIRHASVDSVYQHHRTPKMYKIESCIAISILSADGSVFGTLCAIDSAPASLDEKIVAALSHFTELIAAQLYLEDGRAELNRSLLAGIAGSIEMLKELGPAAAGSIHVESDASGTTPARWAGYNVTPKRRRLAVPASGAARRFQHWHHGGSRDCRGQPRFLWRFRRPAFPLPPTLRRKKSTPRSSGA